ncbi:DUF4056 domain-containing protein [Accumulibacter sp.]|uniref:DUF4056 domain-containing protein n=1 Tax=Accumulibacter sp. TaxID=2053492 RepID=UPI002BB0383B|nr:DUF4056 domain-containing protein [Accumulibacter sp.]HNB69378.1 DUF4056 domain-containing protein [Accumulibacter sp.]
MGERRSIPFRHQRHAQGFAFLALPESGILYALSIARTGSAMSKRTDIIDGKDAETRNYGLVYTRKCGWIDLGHANPASARGLWRDILATQTACHPSGYSRVVYQQRMSKFGITASASRQYEIKDSLTLADQKAVALAIFLDVSIEFERMQSNWFYSMFTDSGFSAEDLVSDLLGFYRAVAPGTQYVKACEPVSQADALAIWDRFGPVGSIKNTSPGPYLYTIDPATGAGSAVCAQLPPFLRSIAPAVKGDLFRDVPP